MGCKKCANCNQELVFITVETYKQALKELSPNFRTARKVSGKRYEICPECDAYGLGAELAKGYQLILQDGSISRIDKLLV